MCVRYIFSLCAAYATLNNLRCVAAYACLGENLYFVVILGIWRREGKTRAVRRWLLIFTLKIINLWAYYKPHGPTVEYLELSHLIWMKLPHNSVTKIKYIFWITLKSRPSTAKRKQKSKLKFFKKIQNSDTEILPKKYFYEFIMISERKLVVILHNFQRKHAFLTFYLWLFFVPNYHPFTTTTDLDKWQQWQDTKNSTKK